jgi:hypothetical protein
MVEDNVDITAPVPKDLSQQISDFTERAKEPESNIEQAIGRGIGDTGFLQQNRLPTSGIDNNALYAAIERRGSRKYQGEMAQLGSDIKAQALQMRMGRLTQAAQLVNAEHQQNERARMNKYIQNQNRKRARAGVLGNLLGIVGAVGGGVAGGPAGAMAGYQIGQGAGQTYGMDN